MCLRITIKYKHKYTNFLKYLSLFLVTSFLLFYVLLGCNKHTGVTETNGVKATTIRIAYSLSGDIVGNLIKKQGVLEKRLAPLSVSVEWKKFAAGPEFLEALKVGSVDFGVASETSSIFAQASGAPLVYVANIPATDGASSAILVPKDSQIQKLADLKGKKIAFQKGSSANYFLIRALQEAGLKYSDIYPVNLTPPEARAAFIRRDIDAWVIWDPHYALAQKTLNVRVLRNAKNLSTQGSFYVAPRTFAIENPGIIQPILEEIQKKSDWVNANPHKVAELVSSEYGIDAAILEIAVKRRIIL